MGWVGETGRGEGKGKTVNVPLPDGTGDHGFARVYQEIIWPIANRFAPARILVSAGFDSHWKGPLGTLALSLTGYANHSRQRVEMVK